MTVFALIQTMLMNLVRCVSTVITIHKESSSGTVWECASGDGAMSRVLERDLGQYRVVSSELQDNDFVHGERGVDFLKQTNFLGKDLKADNIITNPPYNLALEFAEQAIHLARHKVALLLKLLFLEGTKRAMFFAEHPSNRIYVFSKRQAIYKYSHTGIKKPGMPCYAWFVWDKDAVVKHPLLHWITDCP